MKENSSDLKMEETNIQKSDIKFDPYQTSLENEEKEVNEHTEKEDQEMFASICKQLRVLMKEILKLKTEKPEEWANEVEDKKVKGLMLMLMLRKLSRIQKVRVRDSREKSTEFRQGVDAATLQLQNLLYEVSHLKKEVRKCLEFQSADAEIDLVPIDQFYLEAPENISRPEETVEDAHQQRLAQLHWELEQRRGQTQLFDKLKQEKEKVADIISEQEGKLSSLIPRINAVLEATQPLQKALNLLFDDNREQQKTSYLLPAPLYTLWVQAFSYGEACDSSIHVEIQGDLEAARKLITPEDDARSEVSDSEGELDLQEERKSRGRSEKRTQDSEDTEDTNLKQLLTLHPLHIVLSVKTKDNNTIIIKFHYAQQLRIVTTKCYLDLAESSKPLLVDILNSDSLLNLLFPGDEGTTSPNPANEYLYQRLRLSNGLTEDHLKVIGKPYKWAQTLAGLSFMKSESPSVEEAVKIFRPDNQEQQEEKLDDESEESSTHEENKSSTPSGSPPKNCSETLSWKVSVEHMHITLTAIKRRLQARLSLHAQFLVLESASSTSAIPLDSEVLQDLFPGKVSSEFRSWKPITWLDYEASPTTQHLIQSGCVNPHCLPFKAIFQRQAVTLEALVSVSPDHPNVPPIFSLKIIWNKEHTTCTSPHLRQMECELNTHYGELVSSRSERLKLLPLQLYRLAMCLDILTEATSLHLSESANTSSSSQTHFHKEKIFFRPARGPDRALPFKYLPKLGVFAQR